MMSDIKFKRVNIKTTDYDRNWLVDVTFQKFNKENELKEYTCTEILLNTDMDLNLVAEKFERLSTQIKHMWLGNESKS